MIQKKDDQNKLSPATRASIRMKVLKRKRREQGLCTVCGKPLDRDGVQCKACLEKSNAYARERREMLLAVGLCPICGKHEIFPHEKSCLECKAKRAADGRYKKVEAYNRSVYAKRKEQGLCPRCGKNKPEEGYTWCRECLQKRSLYKRKKVKRNVRAEWDSELRCINCGSPDRVEGQKYCEDCYRVMVYTAKHMREKRNDNYKKSWNESNMRMRARFKRIPN